MWDEKTFGSLAAMALRLNIAFIVTDHVPGSNDFIHCISNVQVTRKIENERCDGKKGGNSIVESFLLFNLILVEKMWE